MNDAQFREIQRRMVKNPKSVLAAARRGSPPEACVLSNKWHEVPELISPEDALDVFLHHLEEDRVPRSMNEQFSDPANLAFTAILGLSKVGPYLEQSPSLLVRVANAWDGIFKWSVYLFSGRVEGLQKDDRRRRSALDVISACWYTIGHHDLIREAMIRTPATLEIATRCWLDEDDGPIPSNMNAPVGTCVLGNLLKYATFDQLNRVLKIAGNKADEIAKLALSRLRNAAKKRPVSPLHLTIYLDFINSLSRSAEHPLRYALLGANVIWIVTDTLVTISAAINNTQDLGFLDAMVSGFGYLSNCLDSTDGFTWISQSVGAGLLHAFTDCSPHFSRLDADDLNMILRIVGDIVPRYLVYRTVIEAVDSSMVKIDRSPQKARVMASVAKDVWNEFSMLTRDRVAILREADVMKGQHIICDNVKCQKAGTKEEVRRCSACLTTFYCSKECQATAWKEGNHRTICKMKQRERTEGKSASMHKRDVAFFHSLSMSTARKNLPRLRRIAQDEFGSVPLSGLVICINYSAMPTEFTLQLLETYDTGPTCGSANAEARNDALVERVKENPEKYTLIESRIACGQSLQCVLTLATGAFWTCDSEMLDDKKLFKDSLVVLRDLLKRLEGETGRSPLLQDLS